MEGSKRSIVNYDDDEDEKDTLNRKESTSKDLQKRSKSDRKEEDSHKRHGDHHRHHSRHASSSSSSSRSQHRHKTSYDKRAHRRHSPSPSRSSRNDGRHSYNRSNCRKSKFDNRRSPSRESSHRHKRHRSRTPERKTEVKNVKPEEITTTKVVSSPKPVKLETIPKLEPIQPMLPPPAPPKPIIVPNLPNLSFASSLLSKKSEQEMKRKLLWGDSKKTTETTTTKPSASVWAGLQFQGERGSQMTEKFRKLMGIKDSSEKTEAVAPKDGDKDSNHADAINSKQATLFKNLDEQYSIARMSTHTHRGVGLGFANHRLA